MLANSKSNSSTRLPRRTTTLVSSGCEASMIILFAMINSLAERESARRGPMGPLARAARGVYAGGRKIHEWDGKRRVRKLFGRRRHMTNRPRRTTGGRDIVGLPSGHRQPENKTPLGRAAIQAAPSGADVTNSNRVAGRVRQVESTFRLRSPCTDARHRCDKRSDGSTTRPGQFPQTTGHRMMVPANTLLKPKSNLVA